MASRNRSTDIGRFIRQQVIPPGMTVTEAARNLGVGRPALSNLLNGRAALSQNMALRLEATFGADRARLLELQAAGDRDRRSVEERSLAVGPYAPSFLTIRARQIEEWAAGNIEARDRLPVLLRRLVHATGRELRHVDFPGYDNAQRHGWDGRVEADAATLWVPEGRSFWEFGVAGRPGAKAERDYGARLGVLAPGERAKCTFVFVTPRKWPGKDEWVRGKEAAEDWKAVRAVDASDLEQWLENTIAPRIWLAGELGIPTEGFRTLDRFWDWWAQGSNPPMTDAIFAPSVAAHADRLKTWLEKTPGDGPLTVAADSREEAVAFLACLFRHGDPPVPARDHAVVFELAGTLRTLSGSRSPFIPIVYGEETEREISSHYRQRHCIVARPRNAVDREPDMVVELLGHEAFGKALENMGVTERDHMDRLASESGRSPTVLRRRLSPIPEIRTPSWAKDAAVARSLIPMALVGAWHNGSPADREILAVLSDRPYEEVEKGVADLLVRDDCPVWRVDQYRGVVSKLDALFAIRPRMTERDITDFVDFAEYVLSESDPTLELPDDQRWAGVYGKVREHSNALRNGVCETLVLLAVHGAALLRNGLGIDPAALVAALVERLLSPLTSDTLRSQDRDLPGYAEAAPDQFLALIEADLRKPEPVLEELLTPVGHGPFEHPWRTGLLWALERLAWNPQTFPRVIRILARLSQTKIDDNWDNKPIGSLSAIVRSWLPQTAASSDDRIRALETLCSRFPEVGWRICIQQFDGRAQVAFPSNRPRWRNDAAGAGHGVAGPEEQGFVRKAIDLAISWPTHDQAMLGDLVERLDAMPHETDRSAVWNRIDDWSRTEGDENARAQLRERIRRSVLTRRGLLDGLSADHRGRAREICEKLASRDPIHRHAWLFAGPWVDYSADELDDEHLEIEERERRIDDRRGEAMTEIWAARGLDGALGLLCDGHAWTVGRYAVRCASDQEAAVNALRACLSIETESPEELDLFMQGFISCLEVDVRSAVISTLAQTATTEQRVRLFKCAPFIGETWRLLDGQAAHVRDRYWRVVFPEMKRFTESETTELIDRLVDAGRPVEAFSAVQFDWDKVETSRLKRLMSAIVEVDPPPGRHLDIEPWSLSKALDSLDRRPGVTVGEMARLEFAHSDALLSLSHTRRRGHGIPNLEQKTAESPVLFVQVLALAYKRDDDGEDPPEWCLDDSKTRVHVATAAYRLLGHVARIPGSDTEDRIDAEVLSGWVADARRLCGQHGRMEIGDQEIGQLLSKAPSEEDGSWPCRPVCDVLERVASQDVAIGFRVGVYNARGVVSRGLEAGGVRERELSARYRAWSERLAFDYPYVSNILERIAKRYDREADWEDSEVLARMRMQH